MSEHYFTEKPTSELTTKKVHAFVRGKESTFMTPSGVFSYGRIDRASLLLCESATIKSDWDILDLGCGWGFVGITLKKVFPDTNITMTDVNQRATKLAKENAKHNNTKVIIKYGNLYEPIKNKKFDTILTNPPMKAGRKLCYDIIEQAPKHLKSNGLLQLVANNNKGGKMLKKKMEEVFGNAETIAKKSGFHVYISKVL